MDEIAIAIGKLVYVLWVHLIIMCFAKFIVLSAHFYKIMREK